MPQITAFTVLPNPVHCTTPVAFSVQASMNSPGLLGVRIPPSVPCVFTTNSPDGKSLVLHTHTPVVGFVFHAVLVCQGHTGLSFPVQAFAQDASGGDATSLILNVQC
jgi:hypothetical protein